jgi:hypothetical protein
MRVLCSARPGAQARVMQGKMKAIPFIATNSQSTIFAFLRKSFDSENAIS